MAIIHFAHNASANVTRCNNKNINKNIKTYIIVKPIHSSLRSESKTNGVSKIIAHQRLFNLNESKHVKVSINEKTIIDACVDLVTINGRPFSMLNDTGFRRILDPVLNGFQKKFKINSNIIK